MPEKPLYMKRLTRFFTLIAITLATYLTTAADTADDNIYLRMVADADDAIARQDFEKAAQLLTDAINFQPDSPNNALLMSNLGMVRFYMNDDSLAVLTLNHAHKLAPSSVTILLNRARVLSAMGRVDEAVKDYDNVTELDSTVVMPYLFRGLLALGNSDLQGALDEFEKIKMHAPSSIEEAIAFGNYYFYQQDYANALPYYRILVKAEPTAENYAARAMCLLFTDDLDGASEDIADGLALDPEYGELYLCRALLYKRRYRQSDSLADARRAVEYGVPADIVNSMLNIR